MEQSFTDQELADGERQARLTADLCRKHGQSNGATAADQQARAFKAEIEQRAKG